MSAGALPETILADVEVEFRRITGLGPFYFPAWYCERLRALRASMGERFPPARQDQERALIEVLRRKAALA